MSESSATASVVTNSMIEDDSEEHLAFLASVSLMEIKYSSDDRPSSQSSQDYQGSEDCQHLPDTSGTGTGTDASGTHSISNGSILSDYTINLVLPYWLDEMHYPNDPWKEFFNDAESPFESIDRLHKTWNGQIAENRADLYILDRYLPNRDVRLPESAATIRIHNAQQLVRTKLGILRALLRCDDEYTWNQRVGIVLYMILRRREGGSPNEEANMLFLNGALDKWQMLYEWHIGPRR